MSAVRALGAWEAGEAAEVVQRDTIEGHIKLLEVEAELMEARAAQQRAEAELAAVRAAGQADAERSTQSALEEAKKFVMAEAAAFDEKLVRAQAAFDERERERDEQLLVAEAEAAEADEQRTAERARGALERAILQRELAEREEATAGLIEREAAAAVESRVAAHTHAAQLGAVNEELGKLSAQVAALSDAAAAARVEARAAEAVLASELRDVEDMAMTNVLRKWWTEASATAAATATHPLGHDAARQAHVAALRTLLASRLESESVVAAALSEEVRALEAALAETTSASAASRVAAGRLGNGVVDIGALHEAEGSCSRGEPCQWNSNRSTASGATPRAAAAAAHGWTRCSTRTRARAVPPAPSRPHHHHHHHHLHHPHAPPRHPPPAARVAAARSRSKRSRIWSMRRRASSDGSRCATGRRRPPTSVAATRGRTPSSRWAMATTRRPPQLAA